MLTGNEFSDHREVLDAMPLPINKSDQEFKEAVLWRIFDFR